MKKFHFLLLAVVSIILAACSMESPFLENANEGTTGETYKIGFSISTLNNPFFVTLSEGAKENASNEGAEISIIDAQDDASKQAADVEDLIQQGVDLILINPVDSSAIGSAVESANAAGIPVITVDRSTESGEVVAHIASDNVAGGVLAGEYLLEQVGEGAKVAMLEGIAGSSAARDRGEGFLKAVDGKVELVSSLTANFDRGEGLTVMENMLQANPGIEAVFAQNDEMALGALEAIKAANKKIVVIGFDATDDALAKIEAGEMAASVAQKPEEIGKAAIETAVKYLNGETVEEFVPVDLELVKK
ncbi:ribose ABC transporter substrate-binding protein RbsB [Lysinibacillus endophyticus]|uniref:ribose ABC transporter substrate-binding protein RbsB n=1 Tax=Ureibacillus endophyticus TaxID=1978490 RepID=UPI00209D7ECB|nr:ribose ABC transporter substrate-binding protein RbsB [Lysinibacillus endophyticus]MCP1144403.1 ribose ABC transporter substrate-binding protein RbsB [Lysinibacillus endophyticus]